MTEAKLEPEGPLVWIDCEMTGLDPDSDHILEIFCLITTADLQVLDPVGFSAVIATPESRLLQMDAWCTRTHTATGLWSRVLSADAVTPAAAAAGLLEYIQQWVPQPRTALLAGSSVHADRAFLRRGVFAPVVEYLHYRILDVSAIKEAARRWCPERVLRDVPSKTGLHRAKEDILDSINEAKYYKEAIFARA
ncbi:hypothetical protein TD95_001087 [Thielaviopsis punctulata]|uniref:Exonuclease domain-containing protein n=1 Tax=Thielaviopsis punctulata TaxID=72032 RepID=A0A0F4ZKA8_9PEZI|nr:hypothetical protein TD95_001087 [Thielaviopsis punctulata]